MVRATVEVNLCWKLKLQGIKVQVYVMGLKSTCSPISDSRVVDNMGNCLKNLMDHQAWPKLGLKLELLINQ